MKKLFTGLFLLAALIFTVSPSFACDKCNCPDGCCVKCNCAKECTCGCQDGKKCACDCCKNCDCEGCRQNNCCEKRILKIFKKKCKCNNK